MLRLLVIAKENGIQPELYSDLIHDGLSCLIIPYDRAEETVNRQLADIVLLEMDASLTDSKTLKLVQNIKHKRTLPVVALIPVELLDKIDGQLDVDDFITSPCKARELVLRIKRLHQRAGKTNPSNLIKCDGLMINPATCEVTVEGRTVELTFKEYELLKLMAANRGRVYTREDLLNKVWGYDYYGGDRTVDVHIRRLRSKIEDSKNTFIETVRNIGYRFKKEKG